MTAGSGEGRGGHYVRNKDGSRTWVGSCADEIRELQTRIDQAKTILSPLIGWSIVNKALAALCGHGEPRAPQPTLPDK